MGLQINIKLNTTSGLQIPSGSLLLSDIQFPKTVVVENGTEKNPLRYINYDLFNYLNVQAYLNNDEFINGGVKEFSSNWSKEMSKEEYSEILANGSLAEVWLRDYLISILGEGSCELVDPFGK